MFSLSLPASCARSSSSSASAPGVLGKAVADLPLGRRMLGALRGARHALLAQDTDRRLHVSVRLLECALAVHHRRAGLVAELLDERRGDLSHPRAPLQRPAPPRPVLPQPALPQPAPRAVRLARSRLRERSALPLPALRLQSPGRSL